jgi:hypothetical protein
MCTLLESHKMALSFGALGKYEVTERADLKDGKNGVAPFMPCLRHNRENHRNGEK